MGNSKMKFLKFGVLLAMVYGQDSTTTGMVNITGTPEITATGTPEITATGLPDMNATTIPTDDATTDDATTLAAGLWMLSLSLLYPENILQFHHFLNFYFQSNLTFVECDITS